MLRRHLLSAMALLTCGTNAFSTEAGAQRLLRTQAIANATLLKHGNILADTEGDLNEDGLADYAAVVRSQPDKGTTEQERLVVLAGTTGGAYRLLSLSGEYCDVSKSGKFYELSITGTSLFVKGVWVAEGERYSAITMQFRYNRNLHDLQLIGEVEETRSERQDYRVSFNYLTRTVAHRREAGKRRKEATGRLGNGPLLRLRDYICASQDIQKPSIYIDEHFRLKRQ